ncbi:MAG: hypothetical protein AAF368_08040, partial [Planctomycetota bacterium]
DRVVAGALTVTVPVPLRSAARSAALENGSADPQRTFWVRTRRIQKALWILLPLLLLFLKKRPGYSIAAVG